MAIGAVAAVAAALLWWSRDAEERYAMERHSRDLGTQQHKEQKHDAAMAEYRRYSRSEIVDFFTFARSACQRPSFGGSGNPETAFTVLRQRIHEIAPGDSVLLEAMDAADLCHSCGDGYERACQRVLALQEQMLTPSRKRPKIKPH